MKVDASTGIPYIQKADIPSLYAKSAVSMAEPAPHHEAINVIDNAQNGSVLPAKKKSRVSVSYTHL